MNPEVKELWTRALRSGDYAQGVGKLTAFDTNGLAYCCLGVLCDLAAQRNVVSSYRDHDYAGYDLMLYGEAEESCFLPEEVLAWAELSSNDPIIAPDDATHCTRAIEQNDTKHKTFNEIADLIDNNL